MTKNKILVFIPTYNERENIEEIFSLILKTKIELDILFLDDNSPDGTGKILDQLVKKHSNLNVIHRSGKLGIGSAHLEGINWAYKQGYSTLITMDCDFTHKPDLIPEFINSSTTCDVVIGSRFINKNSLSEWNLFRVMLTNFGHFLTKYLLKLQFDATGAFRLYNLNKIPNQVFNKVNSRAYSFFFESLFVLNINNFNIHEIPIDLPARSNGSSKQTVSGAFKALLYLIKLYIISKISFEKFFINK